MRMNRMKKRRMKEKMLKQRRMKAKRMMKRMRKMTKSQRMTATKTLVRRKAKKVKRMTTRLTKPNLKRQLTHSFSVQKTTMTRRRRLRRVLQLLLWKLVMWRLLTKLLPKLLRQQKRSRNPSPTFPRRTLPPIKFSGISSQGNVWTARSFPNPWQVPSCGIRQICSGNGLRQVATGTSSLDIAEECFIAFVVCSFQWQIIIALGRPGVCVEPHFQPHYFHLPQRSL